MTRHIRGLSQRARLAEFVFSESGAMSAQRAAQMGAVLAASVLAGLLMKTGTAEACRGSCTTCWANEDCAAVGMLYCRSRQCGVGCTCTLACTNADANYC